MIQDNNKLSFLINIQKKQINYMITNQKNIKKVLLDYIQQISNCPDNIDLKYSNDILKFLGNLKTSLNLSRQNIALLNETIKILDNVDDQNFESFYNKYDKMIEIVTKNTQYIQNFLHSILSFSELKFFTAKSGAQNNGTDKIQTIETPTSISKVTNNNENVDNTLDKIETKSNFELNENTLIISETKGKVFLPYKVSEVESILKENSDKYQNVEEVIEQIYTLPFDYFKSLSFSRFREAYKLARNIEKKSIKYAFDLGMELIFNYNLHPAIITACRSLDELDIYLDYLENNETDKFDCFKIVFEMAPIVSKKKLKD